MAPYFSHCCSFYVCNGSIFCVFSNRPKVAEPSTCDEPRRSHGDDQLRLRLSMSPHKHSTPTQSSPQARRRGRYRLSVTRRSREEGRQSEEEQRTPVSAAVHEVRWLCVALRRLSLGHPAASRPLVYDIPSVQYHWRYQTPFATVCFSGLMVPLMSATRLPEPSN